MERTRKRERKSLSVLLTGDPQNMPFLIYKIIIHTTNELNAKLTEVIILTG